MLALIAFTENGERLCVKIANKIEADILVFHKYAKENEIAFDSIEHIQKMLTNYSQLVFVCATGIAVRTIAPFVKDKTKDFAVVVCDELGKFAISLLSGHLGGGNELAENIAKITEGQPVITTATDINNKTAIDIYAKENSLEIGSMALAKEVSSSILRGEMVAFESDFNLPIPKNFTEEKQKLGVYVTYKNTLPFENTLYLYKKCLVLGIGCKRDIPLENLEEHITKIFEKYNLSKNSILKIATIDIKKDENAILSLSKKYDVEIEVFTAEQLNAQVGEYSKSDFVAQTVGVDCVCERAVVASGGNLIVNKEKGNGVTLAIGLV